MITTEKIDKSRLPADLLLRTEYLEKRIDIAKLATEGLEIRNESDQALTFQLILIKATGRFFLYVRNDTRKPEPAETVVYGSDYDKVQISESDF